MSVIYKSVTLEETTCCACGVVFAMPADMLRNRQEKGTSFFCPNGHSLSFTKSEAQRLREELEAAQRNLSAARTREQAERDQRMAAELARDKAEAARGRLKRRIKAGVCPCCNRSFGNLQRHIHTKHPDFSKEEAK